MVPADPAAGPREQKTGQKTERGIGQDGHREHAKEFKMFEGLHPRHGARTQDQLLLKNIKGNIQEGQQIEPIG